MNVDELLAAHASPTIMTQITPLAAAVAQSPQALRQAAESRDALARRGRLRADAPAKLEAELEHVVDTAEAVAQANDKRDGRRKERDNKPSEEETDEPHLDVAG